MNINFGSGFGNPMMGNAGFGGPGWPFTNGFGNGFPNTGMNAGFFTPNGHPQGSHQTHPMNNNFTLNGMNQTYNFDINQGTIHLNGQNNQIHIRVNTGFLNISGMNNHVVVYRNEGRLSVTGMNHMVRVLEETPSSTVHSMGMNIQIQQPSRQHQQHPQHQQNPHQHRHHQINQTQQDRRDMDEEEPRNTSTEPQRNQPRENSNRQPRAQRIHLGSPQGMMNGLLGGIFGPGGIFAQAFQGTRHRQHVHEHHHHHQNHQPQAGRTGEVHADRIISGTGAVIPIEMIQGPSESSIFNCPICCEDGDKMNADVCVVECLHWYHFDCLSEWLKKAKDCPTCRVEVTTVLKVSPRPSSAPPSRETSAPIQPNQSAPRLQ